MRKIFFVIFIALNIVVLAQNSLSGVILGDNSEVVVGAEVFVPEIGKGTISDFNGKYIINKIPDGTFKVQYSFLGYENKVVIINFNKKDIVKNIELVSSFIHTEEVVVSGGGYTSQHENAIKIETINAKRLNQKSNISFIKKLAQTPGIDAISKGNGIASPVIRGLSRSNILVLTNGIRMENFQFSENHPFMIDENGIDHVEFVKGPASLLYGSDAIGGIINIITEKPAPSNFVKVDVSSKYNTNTKGVNSNIGVRVSRKKIFFGIRAGLSEHKDFLDAKEQQVINSRFKQKSIKSFVGLNTKNAVLKLFFEHNKKDLGLTIPYAISVVSDNNRDVENWYQDLTSNLLYLKNKFFLKELKSELNISYQHNNRKLHTTKKTPVSPIVNMNLQTIQYEFKNNYEFNKNAEIIFAFQGMYQNNKNNNTTDHILPNYNLSDLSLFSLFNYKFDKLNTQLGVRYTYRNIKIPGLIDVNFPTFFTDVNNHYHNISYSAGSTYKVNKNILIRANFASAFRTPNINELSQNGVHGNRYEQGDINLKLQRNFEADLSSHIHYNKFTFNIASFYNIIDNYIYLSPTTKMASNGMMIYKYSQNNSSIYGFETSFNYTPVKWFSIHEGYSYLIAEQENGDYLPFIPQNKITGHIDFQILNKKNIKSLVYSITNIIAFEQNNYAFYEDYTPNYNVFNTSLFYKNSYKRYNYTISISVNNLLNEVYFDHLSTIKNLGYYNIGRNFTFGVSINY